MQMIASDKLKVVVGIGVTGLSVARYLADQGKRFVMVDTRTAPPALEQFQKNFPDVAVELGDLQSETLSLAGEIIVSPGVSLQHPALQQAAKNGVSLIGDIELFVREVKAPVIAITGSNGKSTVTTLLGEMCSAAGKNVGVGGNLGTPALELLDDSRDLYVLELSSFQLEAVSKLNAEVAVVLNISPDHMDRYDALVGYHAAKHRIFFGARQAVVNRADPLTQPLLPDTIKRWSFGLDKPDFHGFGLTQQKDESWLTYQFEPLMPETEVAIKGRHNTANALAALALGSAVGLPRESMLETLRHYKGLPHRCQTVAEQNGVIFINDSKATNVGATLAAIAGLSNNLSPDNGLILIAGGQGKEQDFSALGAAVEGRVKLVVLMGEDAQLLGDAIGDHAMVISVDSMIEAVAAARQATHSGDIVLLSPACASFDMFNSFEDRGEQFAAAVEVAQ